MIGISTILLYIPSMILMGVSYNDRGRYTPLIRGGGTALFSLYWITQIPAFLGGPEPDIVNAIMSLLGVFFFLFITYHFLLDFRWGEDTKALQWVVRTSLITGWAYLILENVQITQGVIIYVVALLTYYILILLGHDIIMEAGLPTAIGDGVTIFSADPNDITITIVFACTAALALFLFSGAIFATETNKDEWRPWARREIRRNRNGNMFQRSRRNGIINMMKLSDRQRKWRAFLIVIPIIFITNIFRNVGVIAVVFGGVMDFYVAHNYYAKFMSLGMMMFLTWVLFEYLPELQENLIGLFDLTKRVRKGMIKNGRVDLKYLTKKGEQ